MISACENLLAEIEPPIGWVVFNDPARRNAVSFEMWEAMQAVLERYEHEADVRTIVLRGAGGKAFSSGGNISQFERSSPERTAHFTSIVNASMRKLSECVKPTIAMIEGSCIGGGLSIALACDLRIAAETARFGMPAARLGSAHAWDAMKKFTEGIGPSFTKELYFTGRQFSAAEAVTMRLINRAVTEAELEGFVRDYAATIAANAPLSIEAAKGVIHELQKPVPQIDRARCDELVERARSSRDFIEGAQAFKERRKPVWTGS